MPGMKSFHHGYYHENPTLVNRDTERRLMDLAFACYKRHFGIRPVDTVLPIGIIARIRCLLEEAGFLYDSSLMARILCLTISTLAWSELGQGKYRGRPARFWKFLLAGIWMIFPHWRTYR